MQALVILTLAELLALVTGVIAYQIAESKGRSGAEGFWIGFFLSFLGITIELILPKGEQRQITKNGLRLIVNRQNQILRECPFCAEMVLAEASVCCFCNRNLPAAEKPRRLETHWRGKREIAK